MSKTKSRVLSIADLKEFSTEELEEDAADCVSQANHEISEFGWDDIVVQNNLDEAADILTEINRRHRIASRR